MTSERQIAATRLNELKHGLTSHLMPGGRRQPPHPQEEDHSRIQRAVRSGRAVMENAQLLDMLSTYEKHLHRKLQAELKQLRGLDVAGRADENMAA